ncbi:hypothetical protein PIB30_078044 [Stylosanthes scabra]|uniref:Uncharacterized protein n=1 Tax=Stylosanthes scabra TaxID=79078 RepID=A0ABU6WP08_9FABA|nr:hypothetical protein [Stylosanthes scabra]
MVIVENGCGGSGFIVGVSRFILSGHIAIAVNIFNHHVIKFQVSNNNSNVRWIMPNSPFSSRPTELPSLSKLGERNAAWVMSVKVEFMQPKLLLGRTARLGLVAHMYALPRKCTGFES